MKLKKIASLMLAGIMAVSMLTACEGGAASSGDAEKEENQAVVSTNAASYASAALSNAAKEYVTVKSSSTLDGWVEKIATDTSKFKSNDIEYDYKTVFEAKSTGAPAHQETLRNELKKKVADGNVVYVAWGDGLKNAPTGNVTTRTSSLLYVLSGALDEKSAVESVTEYMEKNASNMVSEIATNADANGTYKTVTHTCDYDVEVSAVRVTNDGLKNGESAWVIGIVVTQNITKVANTEV